MRKRVYAIAGVEALRQDSGSHAKTVVTLRDSLAGHARFRHFLRRQFLAFEELQ